MSRWFRFYEGVVDDPKVQRLPATLFKFWVNAMCLASRNGDAYPSTQDMAFSLRMSEKQVDANMAALADAGLVDEVDGKSTPHNWSGRQFKSDVSNDRVKRHRQRNRNGDVTADVTPPEQSRADTESEQNRDSAAGASPRVQDSGEEFRLEAEKPPRKPSKKAIVFVLPPWVPAEPWAGYVEMRKKIKHPLTDYAMKLAVDDLEKLRDKGHAPATVLDYCTLKSYRGIFPPPAGAVATSTTNGTAAIPANLEAIQAAEEELVRQNREKSNVH